MSLHVKEALEKFATSDESNAIVLKGHWGVGKTYLWNSVVKSKKEKLGKGYYSCVSLFGLNSLKELRQSIYENLVARNFADESGGVRSVEDRLEGVMSFLRKNSKLLSGIKGVGPVVESYQSSALNNALICIDDFERKGKGLSDGEVLGLISQLVEKRNCSVVLILNEDAGRSGDDDFCRYREKVFLFELGYSPSSLESARLVLDEKVDAEQDLIERVVRLEMTNVRLIRKIKYCYDKVTSLVEIQNEKVLKDIRSVLPLAVLARYGSDIAPITLEELEAFESWVPSLLEPSEDELKAQRKKEAQVAILTSYGYYSTSDLDKAMIHLVREGYFEVETVKQVLRAMELAIKSADAERLFSKAWVDFHTNFTMTQEEIVNGFDVALESYGEYLSVGRLDSVVRLYRELGLDAKADQLIERCFERLSITRSLTDRRELWDGPQDEKINNMLDTYFSGFGSTMSLQEAIKFLLEHRANDEAVAVLAHSSEDDYFTYFAGVHKLDFKAVVRLLLGAAGEANIFDDVIVGSGRKIFMAMYGALRRVSNLSKVHEIRIRPLMTCDDIYSKYSSE